MRHWEVYRSVVMCLGHPPKIHIHVVVCSFDVYRVSQSGIVVQVKYAKASYVLGPLLRRFSPVRAFVIGKFIVIQCMQEEYMCTCT